MRCICDAGERRTPRERRQFQCNVWGVLLETRGQKKIRGDQSDWESGGFDLFVSMTSREKSD